MQREENSRSVALALPTVLIPCYQPKKEFLELVRALASDGFEVVVVDDGSSSESRREFDLARKIQNVTVLSHSGNQGKGAALKTAFRHELAAHPGAIGAVTADADGQHSPRDIRRVAEELRAHPRALVLGARAFDGNTPLRSRFGNNLTRRVFQFIVGKRISDTQTGLRGIPAELMARLTEVPSQRYEFELDMLIKAVRDGFEIREVPIETIYKNGNRASHFNPFLDSLRIYFVFVRFFAASILSALVDIAAFAVLFAATSRLAVSVVAARCVSGAFNFALAKHFAFRSRGKTWGEAVKYAALALTLVALTYVLISVFVRYLFFNVYFAKVASELTLFILSFVVQRTLVFRR